MKRKIRRVFAHAALAAALAVAPAPRACGEDPEVAATPAQAPKEETRLMPTIQIGDIAPDFTLKDNAGRDVTLSSFRGEKQVVLAFYVFAFTGG